MSKYTPGPWKINLKNGHLEKVCKFKGSYLLIATITFHRACKEINKANANLIVVAPKMLSLLEDIRDWGESFQYSEEIDQVIAEAKNLK